MFNQKKIESNWKHIKSQVLKKWGKLSNAEVERTRGNPRLLSQLVFSKYGMTQNFNSEYKAICDACIVPEGSTIMDQPFKSPDMIDGWKQGQGMQTTEGQLDNETANQDKEIRVGYQNVDVDLHKNNIKPDPQVNIRETDEFKQSTENIISDRSYIESPDEFSSTQHPYLTGKDIPLGGSYSSAKKSSAHNAVFNSFEDHSRNTKKL